MGSVASAHSSASAAARRDLRRTYQNVPPATAPTASTTFHFTRSTLAAVLIASLAKLAPRLMARSARCGCSDWAGTVSVYEATPGDARQPLAGPGRMRRTAFEPAAAGRQRARNWGRRAWRERRRQNHRGLREHASAHDTPPCQMTSVQGRAQARSCSPRRAFNVPERPCGWRSLCTGMDTVLGVPSPTG